MCKKLIISLIVLAVLIPPLAYGGGPFKHIRNAARYVWTGLTSWSKDVEDNVPLDLKIKHAREQVVQLGPDIRRCLQQIARQQVDIEELQQGIARRRLELERQKSALLKLRNDLKRGEEHYVYAGHTYSAAEVRRDLALRFDRYRTLEEALKRDEAILAARKKALQANERRVEEMLAARKQLEVQIEQLEARWKTLQAAQSATDLEFDDSQLAQTKMLIRKISRELDVRDKMLAANGNLSGVIPVDEKKPLHIPLADVTKQIDEHFAGANGRRASSARGGGL